MAESITECVGGPICGKQVLKPKDASGQFNQLVYTEILHCGCKIRHVYIWIDPFYRYDQFLSAPLACGGHK